MPELSEQLQRTLGAAYTLERELGGGGMSRVFVAVETALGRHVVIKVLAPELAEGFSADRFAREIRLAARLQHPNIVPLLSAGSTDGLPWYTMPFVRGDSLRARLNAGTIELRLALRIIGDVTRALAYAHDAGVVHRDIKPENVLISEGVAVVTDFGIAKAMRAAQSGGGNSKLTSLGLLLGTPGYVAPEQATSATDIDHRADLYALGIMAYELFAGRHPFADKKGAHQLIVAHLTKTPAPLAPLAPALAPEISEIIMQCMAKDPADRPASATAILEVLEAPPVIVAARTPSANESAPLIESAAVAVNALLAIAVLPFVNLSNDPDNEYLADGITDEVLGTLARSRTVRVAGRASCFALKGLNLDPHTVGARLNVKFVVEGSVQRVDDRVRISAELLSVADGFRVWTERFDRDVTDTFALQDEIAQAIAFALAARLSSPAPAARAAHRPVNGEAYRLYLLCTHLLRSDQSEAALTHALELVDRSIALDPMLAPAHLARATVLQLFCTGGLAPVGSTMSQARSSARKALALDEGLALAWTIEAQACYLLDNSWEQADAGYERALRIDANDPVTMVRAANYLALRGATDRAVTLCRRAVAIDPLSPLVGMAAANTLRYLTHYDEAIALCRNVLELGVPHVGSLVVLARALTESGAHDAALPFAEQAVAIAPTAPNASVALCVILVRTGAEARARALLRTVVSWHREDRPIGSWIAQGCIALGDIYHALDWLALAETAREYWLPWVVTGRQMDVVRRHPRFVAMMRRLGLKT